MLHEKASVPRSLVCNSRYVSAEARDAFGVPDVGMSVTFHPESSLRMPSQPRARGRRGYWKSRLENIILRIPVALGSQCVLATRATRSHRRACRC